VDRAPEQFKGTSASDATVVGADSGEASGPSLVDQRVVEAAIRRGLITAVQGAAILEKIGGGGSALGSLVERGLVSKDAADDLEDEVKSDFVPGYRLVSELGRGAMGVVYKAVQKKLDRAVALKVVTPNQAGDPSYLKRFKQEALALGKLNHVNIVQVYDYGEVAGKVFLALELIDGRDAAAVLHQKGTFPEAEAVRIVRDAALGLAHAAGVGITHRDVKPANLMLSPSKDARSGPWVTKVTDLGLARVNEPGGKNDAQMTKAGTILGSPAYMAPEQTRGEVADWRADQYALGSTLYHLLTGKVPYADSSAIQVIVKKQTELLEDPRDHVKTLSEGVVRILDRMLARPVDARYPTYEAMIEDLDALLRNEPPATPPVRPDASSLRFSKHDRPLAPATKRMASTPGLALPPPSTTPPVKTSPVPLLAAVIGGVALLAGVGLLVSHERDDRTGGGPATEPSTVVAPPETALTEVDRALTALAGLSPEDRLDQSAALRARIDQLPEAQRLAPRLRLADLVGQALDGVSASRTARLEQLLARADYAGMAATADEVSETYRAVGRDLPPALTDLVATAARARAEGDDERKLWARLELAIPVEVLELADELARRFPWSPARAAAADLKKKAEATAPRLEVSLAPPVEGAKVTVDGVAVPSLPHKARVSAGPHQLVAEAPGHFVRELKVAVDGPTQIVLRLDPKPAKPLVRSSHYERPVWTPSPGAAVQKNWTTTGTWSAKAEVSALVGEAGPEWAVATRSVKARLGEALKSEDAKGWQLGWELVPTGAVGAAEVRFLTGMGTTPGGHPQMLSVVAGVEKDEAYLGIRRGDELELLARRALPPARSEDRGRSFEVDWDGKVALVRLGKELLGSLVLPWTLAEDPQVQAAVRDGTGEVRSLMLRALVESGAH